jgi:O-antigen/teichoic acid export membrane protein
MIFGNFGISVATSKYVAEYAVTRPDRVNRVLLSASALIAGVVLVILGCVFLFGKRVFGGNYGYILLFLPYLFFATLRDVTDGVYRGLKRFKELSLISVFIGMITLAAAVMLIKMYALKGFILAYDITSFLSVLCLILFVKNIEFRFDPAIAGEIFRYSFVIGLSSIAFFMYTKVDILILKQFGYVVEIGYYGIIDMLFNVLVMPALILGTVLAPNITRRTAQKGLGVVIKKLKEYSVAVLSISAVFTVLLYFCVPQLIKVLLPEYHTSEFLSIFNTLLFLLPLKLWGVFCVNGFVVPGGYAKIVTATTFIGGALNIILDYLLVLSMGFIGIFVSTLIVHSVLIIATISIYYNKISMRLAVETAP